MTARGGPAGPAGQVSGTRTHRPTSVCLRGGPREAPRPRWALSHVMARPLLPANQRAQGRGSRSQDSHLRGAQSQVQFGKSVK